MNDPREEFKILPLSEPIDAHEEKGLTELKLYRPKGKDLRKINIADLQTISYPDMMKYIEVCGRIPSSSVDMMDGADVVAGAKIIQDFLTNSRPTGKTSAPN